MRFSHWGPCARRLLLRTPQPVHRPPPLSCCRIIFNVLDHAAAGAGGRMLQKKPGVAEQGQPPTLLHLHKRLLPKIPASSGKENAAYLPTRPLLPLNRRLLSPPHGPGLHSRTTACCAAYSIRSHVKLHHSEVHRVSSPGEVLAVARGHLGEGRDFFQFFSGLGRCCGLGPWGTLSPHHGCVRASPCSLAHMITYPVL